MQTGELLILLLISVAGFSLLARKLKVPEPVMLVVGGLAVSLIPGLPVVELRPDHVFLMVLPSLRRRTPDWRANHTETVNSPR
jgi:CPA1 family monovalent cation:H+ antiporter